MRIVHPGLMTQAWARDGWYGLLLTNFFASFLFFFVLGTTAIYVAIKGTLGVILLALRAWEWIFHRSASGNVWPGRHQKRCP